MKRGWITGIVGCQFAGKTEELIRRVRRAVTYERQKAVVFKHTLNTYGNPELVLSFGDVSWPAISVSTAEEILRRSEVEDADIVAIDGAHFFNETLVGAVIYLARELGKTVIFTGLCRDFRDHPFAVVSYLVGNCDQIDYLYAVCSICGSHLATCTQRLRDGKPAPSNEPTLVVGDQTLYRALCRNCYEIPD